MVVEKRDLFFALGSEEIQQKAVEEYLSSQGSAMAIAEKYKLRSGNLVLDWVKEYHRHRNSVEEAGGASMTKRKHTQEERVQAVREHLENGKSYSELAERYGSTTQVIRNWVKRYQKIGAAGLEDRRGKRLANQMSRTPEEALRIENACLERENYRLKLELDLLKK
ncbi:helix-turn-helix domain-containing protein [Oscillospiraceae bacterium 38-13]